MIEDVIRRVKKLFLFCSIKEIKEHNAKVEFFSNKDLLVEAVRADCSTGVISIPDTLYSGLTLNASGELSNSYVININEKKPTCRSGETKLFAGDTVLSLFSGDIKSNGTLADNKGSLDDLRREINELKQEVSKLRATYNLHGHTAFNVPPTEQDL